MVRMCNTLSMISTRCHLTDIFLLCIQPENTYGAICNNKQFRTKNNNKIGCSKKLVLIIYNNRKSVYCNMQQSNVIVHMHYTDFRPSYNLILRTSIQQILPTAVNLLLILNEKVLVLRLEQVLESALRSQEVLDRKQVHSH